MQRASIDEESWRRAAWNFCDYVFTLILAFGWVGSALYFGWNWIAALVAAHFAVVFWFFKTRPIADKKRDDGA